MGNARRALLAAATMLALAGCSEDNSDQPQPLPPFTASPSPSAVPQPTMPAAAKQHTREGVEAYARYFVDVANYAQRTGDTRGVQSLAGPDCATCAQYVADVKEWYRVGSVRGGLLTITRVHTPAFRKGFSPVSLLDVDVSPVEWFDADGSKVGATEPGTPDSS